jgi:hypothetical protein
LDRGYTRKDIGISPMKEFRIKFSQKVKEIQEQVKEKQGYVSKLSKNGGINNMFNEIFHNLEFTTENIWKEFVQQYQAG